MMSASSPGLAIHHTREAPQNYSDNSITDIGGNSAGVIGLETAIQLSSNYQVTVLAASIPGPDAEPISTATEIDFASPWAGGHWRSHASGKPEDARLRKWDLETLEFWKKVVREEEERMVNNGIGRKILAESGSGLKMYDQYHFWDGSLRENENTALPSADSLWWASHVDGFQRLSTKVQPILSINQKERERVARGAMCRSVSFNVPRYLAWLMARARDSGVQFIQHRLKTKGDFSQSLRETYEVIGREVDCFVNATGLGAKDICGDEAMFPIRGQTVLVKGEADAIRHRIGKDYEAYCIPRPGSGTTILGGTKQANDWNTQPDPETTKSILKHCAVIVPELLNGGDGGFEIISSQCGLRPARKGGPRVERESVGRYSVVHAYGHAGAGYQNSYGCAREVVNLVGESLGKLISLSGPRL